MMSCGTVGTTARPTAADLIAERILVSPPRITHPSMSRTSRLTKEIEQ